MPFVLGQRRVAVRSTPGSAGLYAITTFAVASAHTDRLDLYADIGVHVSSSMFGAFTEDVKATEVTITDLDGSTQPLTFPGWANWRGGRNTGPECIPQACVTVSEYTSQPGRSGRGRMYLPFIAETAAQQGYVAAADVASMQTAWDDFIADLLAETTPITLGVASRTDEAFYDIQSVVIRNVISTQRRRQSRLNP